MYFITRAKENLAFDLLEERPLDPEDPLDFGITHDQLVMTNGKEPLRRIECVDPATGKTHVFLTNEMTLSAGLLAQIFRMRWDVEKVFDQAKNSLLEKKAWAKSETAKRMQAHFLCMAQNPVLLMEHDLEKEHGVVNQAEIRRREQRLDALERAAAQAGRKVNLIYHRVQRFTKRSLKFIRTLRTFFFRKAPIEEMARYLERLYAAL